MTGAALEVRGVSKRFGSLDVARNVQLSLEEGARCALIGPNGAGKTTLVNLISGRLAPTAGEIWMSGRNVTAMPEAARVKAGIGRTFQITNLFRRLTVEENLALAVAEQLGAAGRLWPDRRARASIDGRVAGMLAMLRLTDHAGRRVELLPYGVQRIVELALALALAPKILLLDEPAAGVPRADVGIIFEAIEQLPTSMAVLLIEHDIDVVFRFATRVVVLVAGEVLAEGSPREISEHPQVRALYLGDARHE
ncbi:MAG: ATP-binding cassette domain-containing protein [Acidobacteria bacterium]|nr:ATP-binding cassette domain-containing protein [Acidobacteriota bacterium]